MVPPGRSGGFCPAGGSSTTIAAACGDRTRVQRRFPWGTRCTFKPELRKGFERSLHKEVVEIHNPGLSPALPRPWVPALAGQAHPSDPGHPGPFATANRLEPEISRMKPLFAAHRIIRPSRNGMSRHRSSSRIIARQERLFLWSRRRQHDKQGRPVDDQGELNFTYMPVTKRSDKSAIHESCKSSTSKLPPTARIAQFLCHRVRREPDQGRPRCLTKVR